MILDNPDNYWRMKELIETTYLAVVTALVEGFDSTNTMKSIVALKEARGVAISLYNDLHSN